MTFIVFSRSFLLGGRGKSYGWKGRRNWEAGRGEIVSLRRFNEPILAGTFNSGTSEL